MRISTSQIFDSGVRGIGRNQVELSKLANQMATGRRVVTPEDDPIAASQALVLTQSKAVSEQYLKNQSDAQGKLSIVETQVASVGDLLQSVRARLVQAGSTTLSNSDRSFIAKELEADFSQLMGIANSKDAEGNYLFSGYQGAVKPFSLSASGAVYQGDDGQRLVQVSASRQLATNVSGKELFESISDGNGRFATSALTASDGSPLNTGSGIIDEGSVTDPAKWSTASANYPGGVQIKFSVTGGVTNYQLFDATGTTAYGAVQPYTAGQSIQLEKTTAPASDFGATVVVTGQPADGDSFAVKPSTDQSIFATLRSAINTLTTGISGGSTSTEYSNRIAGSLTDIDQALENVYKVRSSVGAGLNELDSLTESTEDMQLQYKTSLSALQDLDYTEAISEISKKQVQLEAAQLTFKQISQLSLFSIL